MEGGKCICLETLRREWKEFQKGGGYHEGKDRYPNHIIQPISKGSMILPKYRLLGLEVSEMAEYKYPNSSCTEQHSFVQFG
ncbi:MAG: hypothetical protein RXR65_02640 [Hydrogenobaculum sp.]